MFVPIAVPILFALMYAVFSMAIGALSGWLASLATKCNPLKVRTNAFLGVLGFWAGFLGTLLMPWHQNTATEQLEGGSTVTTTMSMYQHPVRVAIVVAALLPVLQELYRFQGRRAHKLQS